jgi:formimidoylglutamase
MVRLSAEVAALLEPASVAAAPWDPHDRVLGQVVQDWRAVETPDVAIVGVPFDTAVLGRRGARFGPTAIRAALYRAYTWGGELGVDLAEDLVLADCGDVRVVHTSVERTHARLRQVVAAVAASGAVPCVLGGDNSLSFATIAGLVDATGGPLGLVVLDAHHDLREPYDGEINSGTPYRRVLELPGQPVRPEHVVQIGLAPFRNSRYYAEWARAQGLHAIPARAVHQQGPAAAAAQALGVATAAPSGRFFLSVDLDVCDPACAPGTSAHSPGGLLPFEILELVLALARHPGCAGFDLVEAAPPLDVQSATSELAATVVLYFLAGRALARRERAG